MPASDIVDSITVISSAAPSPAGFGIPIVGVTLTAPQDALWGGNLIQEFAQDTWPTLLTALGFVDGDPLWEYMQAAFAQELVPAKILVGKEATKVAQIQPFSLTIGVLPDGDYTITVNDEDFTHTAVGGAETGTGIRDALVALFPGAQPVTAAPVATEDGTITADQAGIGFATAVASPAGDLTLGTVTANVGLSTDIFAWEAERTDWYMVNELTGNIAAIASMGAPVESFPRDIIFFGNTSTASDPNATDGTSTTRAAALITAFQRTGVAHRKVATSRPLAALEAKQLPKNPGSTNWSQQELRLITGDTWTSTETSALLGQGTDPGNYAYFEEIPSLARPISRNVRMGDTTPIDLIRGRDWLNQQIVIDVLAALVAEDTIPYTDPGASQITGVISSTLRLAVSRGIGVADSFTVTTTARADQLPADVAARVWKGFVWTMTLQGAIDAVDIRGTLFIV